MLESVRLYASHQIPEQTVNERIIMSVIILSSVSTNVDRDIPPASTTRHFQ